MSFMQIADLMYVPVSQIQLLNPSYKMNVVPFYPNKPHFLRLPKEKMAAFTSNEEKIYAYIERSNDLFLWGPGTFLHRKFISIPKNLISKIEKDIYL